MPTFTRPLSATLLRAALSAICAAGTAAIATPALAAGDIVKCVDADGRVTLTDSPCTSGVSTVVVAAAGRTAPAGDRADSTDGAAMAVKPLRTAWQRRTLDGGPLQHDNWVDPRPHSKMLARDAATLRAARTSLQVLDDSAASIRQPRVAGLN